MGRKKQPERWRYWPDFGEVQDMNSDKTVGTVGPPKLYPKGHSDEQHRDGFKMAAAPRMLDLIEKISDRYLHLIEDQEMRREIRETIAEARQTP